MTKLFIGALILILVIFGLFELWSYWDKVNHDRDVAQKEAAATAIVPESLEGMPSGLEASYQMAQKAGPEAVKNWLRRYGQTVGDPRRAWIELDYMTAISHEDPAEARKIFAEVKSRTPESSPIYSRIKQLEKTYE